MPEDAMLAVLTHHERYDGKGYPQGLKKEIGLFGRIISVADVYDALVSDRPYRRAFLPSEAMEYIMSGRKRVRSEGGLGIHREVAPFPMRPAWN